MKSNPSFSDVSLLGKAKEELDSRYAACDMLEDHVNDEGSPEICSNCYRHLKYKSPFIERFSPSLSEDYSWGRELKNREIQFQKERDFFNGLFKILKRLTEENSR